MNIKILCFIHTFCPKEYAKEMTVYFIYNNCINFIHTWCNWAPSVINVTQFAGVTLISLWFWISYGKGTGLNVNYHIVLHSVAGACVM